MEIGIAIALVAIPFVQIAYHYRHLPQRIAGHFTFRGKPDRYDDKRMFCIVYFVLMIIVAQFSHYDSLVCLTLGLFVAIVVEFVFRFNRDSTREHIGPGHWVIGLIFLAVFLAAIFLTRTVESSG